MSLLCGYVSDAIDPDSVALETSHGYEGSKLFMRNSVLISDLIFFISSLGFICYLEAKKFNFDIKNVLLFLCLLCPPFILIDHGHF